MGLQELGLAYESDAAVTKHIASFVSRHAGQIGECRDGGTSMPSVVLFNGGVFQADPRRQRVMDVLSGWGGDGEVLPVKPTESRRCHAPLSGEDPQPLRHQVWELPPIKPIVSEYQQHRLTCPCCGETACGGESRRSSGRP